MAFAISFFRFSDFGRFSNGKVLSNSDFFEDTVLEMTQNTNFV